VAPRPTRNDRMLPRIATALAPFMLESLAPASKLHSRVYERADGRFWRIVAGHSAVIPAALMIGRPAAEGGR
jgi:hypothetical protein